MSECKIPYELVKKFHAYDTHYDDDPIGVYYTFLIQTDYKLTKLYESVSQDFENAEKIIAEFKEKEAEVIKYRQVAREEYGKFLDEFYKDEEVQQSVIEGYTPSEEADEKKRAEMAEYGITPESENGDDCLIEYE